MHFHFHAATYCDIGVMADGCHSSLNEPYLFLYVEWDALNGQIWVMIDNSLNIPQHVYSYDEFSDVDSPIHVLLSSSNRY